MNTSMQELYNRIDLKEPFAIRLNKREYTEREKGYLNALNNVKLMIKHQYIEKEKKMIIDAYKDGIMEMIERENSHLMCKHDAVSPEQYYNETFKK